MKAVFKSPQSEFEQIAPSEGKQFSQFWKELIPEGSWTHPVRKFTINVDKARLDKWAGNFHDFQKPKSISVPIPKGHNYNPDLNAGFVEDVRVKLNGKGKWALFGLLDIPLMADAEKINATIKGCSIGLTDNLQITNENGEIEEAGESLEHVALTNYEVIKGMEGFVKLDNIGNEVAIQFDYNGPEMSEAPVDLSDRLLLDSISAAKEQNFQLSVGVKVPDEIVNGQRGKATHEECNYRSGTGDNHCSRCLFYLTQDGDSDKGDCTYVEGPIKAVDVCNYYQSKYSFSQEEDEMTPEQLRALEKKFSLKENSLTKENWFDTVSELDVQIKEEEPKVTPEQLRTLEKKFSLKENSLTDENWFDAVNGIELAVATEEEDDKSKKEYSEDKKNKKKPGMSAEPASTEVQQFDVAEHPEFKALKEANHSLLLDRNQRRLDIINARFDTALESGRINKAAYDKALSKGALKFDDKCFGVEFDSSLSTLESQLDIIEQLPESHSVSVTRKTSDHLPNHLDQSEEAQKAMFDSIDKDFEELMPQYDGRKQNSFDSNGRLTAAN